MKNKEYFLIFIIILIILSFFYFTKYDKNNSEVIILNDNQDKVGGLEIYSNEKYGFIFSYPRDWTAKTENSELIQFYNYLKTDEEALSENVLNKVEIVVVEEINYEGSSDYPEKNKSISDIVIAGQNAKKVGVELIGGEKISSYYVQIPSINKYLSLSIYGDSNNFYVLDNIVNSLKWTK